MEYDTTTGKCFISDSTLAAAFGVSAKTVSRAVSNLEQRGFIKRETRNIKGGRERIMIPVVEAIEQELTKDKLTIVEPQRTKSPLSKDNLSIVNGQNDFIKDNIIDKEKDNIDGVILPAAEVTPL
jgi:DNA-binding transcriptional MocR family regulator